MQGNTRDADSACPVTEVSISMRLTFVTWNIAADSGRDIRRQMATLGGLEPTVVALQERKDWDRDYFRALHLAEQLLGMRAFLALSAHHGCHLAVLIREDAGLRVTEQRHEHGHPFWHGAARIVVTARGYLQPVQLASVHLAPSSPTVRLAEAEAFGLAARQFPLIAGGDWNALAARDPEPPAVTGRQQRKLDRRAAEALEEAGLTDVGAHLADMTPTVGHAGGPPYRCDRIYTSLPAETVTGYQVITTADADSDHRPAIARFDLTLASTATSRSPPC
jgi:endonuclease/exonuclease/phosphatase family metal-dependent hydrolase